MKKSFKAMVTAAILGTSAVYGAGYTSLGYASAKTNEVSRNGVTFDLGARFGKTVKQGVGMKYIFIGKNDNLNDGTGNVLDFYYMIGYEVYKDLIVYANGGYGFESLGSVGTGSNKTETYATGFTYGADIVYNISERFDTFIEYKKLDLSYDIGLVSTDFKTDLVSLGIGVKF